MALACQLVHEMAAGSVEGSVQFSTASALSVKWVRHCREARPEGKAPVMMQARVALRLPWWSLSTGFAAVRQMAGLQGDASAVQKALKEQTYAANGALPPGAMPAKDDREVGHVAK